MNFNVNDSYLTFACMVNKVRDFEWSLVDIQFDILNIIRKQIFTVKMVPENCT